MKLSHLSYRSDIVFRNCNICSGILHINLLKYCSSPFELDRISGLLTIKDIQLLNEDITQAFVTAEDNGVPKRKQSTIFYVKLSIVLSLFQNVLS